jgi:hypothetical protein
MKISHRKIKKRQKENIWHFPLPRANTIDAPHSTRILGLKKCDLKLCGAPVHACAGRQFMASCVCGAVLAPEHQTQNVLWAKP